MKITEKKKPVNTIPNGVWESSRPEAQSGKNRSIPSADLQGNGYPAKKKQERK